MTTGGRGDEHLSASRKLRIVALLDAAETVGATPLPLDSFHALAYFVDALAPVWDLPVIDARILKRLRPYYPSIQVDLDQLVGVGVVLPSKVEYNKQSDSWRLDARYELNRAFADRILDSARTMPNRQAELRFVAEIVFAASGLGLEVGLLAAAGVDAAYSNPLVGVGGVVEVDPDHGEGENLTAQVARRFGDLLGGASEVSTAEMVNLYVRELYGRLQVA